MALYVLVSCRCGAIAMTLSSTMSRADIYRETASRVSRRLLRTCRPGALDYCYPVRSYLNYWNLTFTRTPKTRGSEGFSVTTVKPGPADESAPAVNTALFSKFFTYA